MTEEPKKEDHQRIYFPFIYNSWFKSVTMVQEQMAKTLASITLPVTEINKIISAWQENQRALLNLINPFLQIQNAINEQVKAFNETIKGIYSGIDFKQLQETAKYFADEGVRLDVLIKTGWWYCPSMVNVGAEPLKNAALKFKKGNRKAMTNLIVASYHKDNFQLLKSTVNSWQNNKLFKKRMRTIKDSLDAHIDGKYTLSIPALLPLVEGIATEYCKSKKINLIGIRSKGNAKVEKAFEELLNSKGYPFEFPDLFIEILNTVIYQDTSKVNDPFQKKLNRHGVLHGSYVRYYDTPRSLRCFLILDALASLQ